MLLLVGSFVKRKIFWMFFYELFSQFCIDWYLAERGFECIEKPYGNSFEIFIMRRGKNDEGKRPPLIPPLRGEILQIIFQYLVAVSGNWSRVDIACMGRNDGFQISLTPDPSPSERGEFDLGKKIIKHFCEFLLIFWIELSGDVW